MGVSERHRGRKPRRSRKTAAGVRESLLHKAVTYVVTLSLALPFLIFLYLFNRVKIYGKANLTNARPPFLFVCNHVSMLDDFFLGPPLFLPRGFWDYAFIPYHTPERKNFYLGPLVSWVMDHANCVPLTRGKGFYQPGMQRLIQKLKSGGVVQIYPEGTRTRSGEIGKGQAGVGRIIYEARCLAIPCYHSGMREVLPIGKKIPRGRKKIDIIVGEPIAFDEYYEMENKLPTWQKIADRTIEAISALRDRLHEITDRRETKLMINPQRRKTKFK